MAYPPFRVNLGFAVYMKNASHRETHLRREIEKGPLLAELPLDWIHFSIRKTALRIATQLVIIISTS